MIGFPRTLEFRGKLYLVAALVGTLAGLVGGIFHALLDRAYQGRSLLLTTLEDASLPGWLVLAALGALVLILAMWLVRRFAPETAGSGIQEVEAILAGRRTLRWHRVLPVKFVAGALAVGSGLVLGREGPTVHMGSALGQMAAQGAGIDSRDTRALISAGAGAGLAAAFNAPLAAIVFVTEELREHFEYRFASLQSVILASCLAVIVSERILGQGPSLPMQHLALAPLTSLPLFLLLGVLIGAFGVAFNGLLLGSVAVFRQLRQDHAYLVAAAAGAALGALLWFAPEATGGGESLVEALLGDHQGLLFLVLLLAIRTLTTVGSYGVGLPGGIFAPMLALGTIFGAGFDLAVTSLAPGLDLEPGLFAVAAMGALFAATVRAPLTGVVLAIELTGAQDLTLPIILTCLTATFAAEKLGGRPIYGLLLEQGDHPPRPLLRPGRRVLVTGLMVGCLLAIQGHLPWNGQSAPSSDQASVAQVASQGTLVPSARVPEAPIQPIQPVQRPEPSPAVAAEPVPVGGEELAVPSLPLVAETESSQAAEGAVSADVSIEVSASAEASNAAETTDKAPEEVLPSPVRNKERFFIQLISFRSEASLAPFVRRYGLAEQASTVPPAKKRHGWWPVLIGGYASRDEAQAALAALPDRLKRLRPEVRALPPGSEPTEIR